MLVLSRKKNESIIINNDIVITVVEIRGDKVRLGIEAPKDVPVHRQEGYAGLVRVGPGGLALTERLASEVFSLPLYPELTDREVDRVIEEVIAASGSRG